MDASTTTPFKRYFRKQKNPAIGVLLYNRRTLPAAFAIQQIRREFSIGDNTTQFQVCLHLNPGFYLTV
jgi:hypothetical protein